MHCLKIVAGFWHNNVFYRKVIILGRENINPDHHLIFAPNHQNALMDALAVLFTNEHSDGLSGKSRYL